MKAILLPTDFSKNSINAIDFAVTLFRDVACNFYLLNVQKASAFISDDMMEVTTTSTIYNTIIHAAKTSLSNIISKVKERHDNDKHHFYTMVDYDNFIDAINQVSEKHQIELIIMGTKGASGLQKVIFGSHTARVMQRCEVPVLAIPDNCTFSGLDKIALTTNNITTHDFDALRSIMELIKLNDSRLYVLHVADENYEVHEQGDRSDFFSMNFESPVHDHINVKTKDMYNAVHKYVIDNDIKMIGMVGEKHAFFERLFNKDSIEIFAFSIDIPFLVMKTT